MQMRTVWKYLALISTLAAFGLCVYLTQHHYSLQFGQQTTKSFCSVSSSFDCDSVNISSFSKFLGIPIALWGAFSFFVQLLFLLGGLILAEDEKPKALRMYYYFSFINLGFCIYLAIISTFFLKTICFYCAITYLLSALIFVSAFKLRAKGPLNFKVLAQDLKSWTTASFLLVIPFGSFMINTFILDGISKDLDSILTRAHYDWTQNKKYDFYITQAPSVGPANAKLTLVVFSDFECPHCKNAAPSLHAFANAHKNQVQLIYQSYPLDGSCNPKGGGHKYACLMAKAAFCAFEQNQFQKAHDWIFEHQTSLSENTPSEMIKELHLDETKFNECLRAVSTDKNIGEQIARGNMADVQGTPAVYANGRLLPYGFLVPILERALKSTH